MATHIAPNAPDAPDTVTIGDTLRLYISELQYAYEDQPDVNTVERAAWEKAIPKKANRLAKLLGQAPAAPPALPPIGICALFLHNIRARTGTPFDVAQFRPVEATHRALVDGPEKVGIEADFDGSRFPLLPREKLDVNWWRTMGSASAHVSATPFAFNSQAGGQSASGVHFTATLSTRDPANAPAQTTSTPSATAAPAKLPGLSSFALARTPSEGASVPNAVGPGPEERDELDEETPDVTVDGERKRKASKSPSPPPNTSTKCSKSNFGTAA